MALAKQNIPILFGKGIETKLEEKTVPADKMLELENAVFTKRNSFATRFGSSLLSKNILGLTTHIENAKKLLTFQDELLLATKDKLYSYIQSSDAWSERGTIAAVAVTSETVVRNTTSQSVPDGYSLKDVTVYAWEEGSAVKATVFDETSGLPILTGVTLNAGAVKPKVIANNTYIFVYYIVGSSLKMRKINPVSPSSFDGEVTIASNITNNFDIHPHGNNLVYIYSTTASVCNIGYIAQNGLIGTSLTGFPSAVNTVKAGTSSVCIVSKFDGVFTDAIYAFYANTVDGLVVSALNLDLTTIYTSVVDPTTTDIRNITAIFQDNNNVKAYYELYNATKYNALIKTNTVSFGGFIDTPTNSVLSVGLGSKAFRGADNNIYVVAAYESTLQSTYFLMKETFSPTEKLQVASVIAKYEGGRSEEHTSELQSH